jgi:hypothetical protein
VDDLQRLAAVVAATVSVVEPRRGLGDEEGGDHGRHPAARVGALFEHPRDARALDVLEGQPGLGLVTEVKHADDVGVLQARVDAGLGEEAREERGVLLEARQDALDRSALHDAAGPGALGFVDLAHAPATEQLDEAIVSQLGGRTLADGIGRSTGGPAGDEGIRCVHATTESRTGVRPDASADPRTGLCVTSGGAPPCRAPML